MKLLMAFILTLSLAIPTTAQELLVPSVPESGAELMPDETENFGIGLLEIAEKCLNLMYPSLKGACQASAEILCTALLISLLSVIVGKNSMIVSIAGVTAISAMLFQNTNFMIGYALNTLQEICEYGKLLCPVMTTALAAQGAVTTAAALHSGTVFFITLLLSLVSKIIIPMVYLYLAFSVAKASLNEEFLNHIADSILKTLSWFLKIILIAFTSYMSITGVVSGTTDAAALKAAKVTISSVIPVVGSILSDASDSVLSSMGIVKNTAGIYGIFAVLAIFIGPFLQVGVQYILLKATAAICGVFGSKRISELIINFSSAMGILAGMVASSCLMILVSLVCFIKGIN